MPGLLSFWVHHFGLIIGGRCVMRRGAGLVERSGVGCLRHAHLGVYEARLLFDWEWRHRRRFETDAGKSQIGCGEACRSGISVFSGCRCCGNLDEVAAVGARVGAMFAMGVTWKASSRASALLQALAPAVLPRVAAVTWWSVLQRDRRARTGCSSRVLRVLWLPVLWQPCPLASV